MKNKIVKYLKSKEEDKKTVLDSIFEKYINGDLDILLKKYSFSKIEIIPQIKENANYLQINFCYFNLYVTVEFNEANFDYCIYKANETAEAFDKAFKTLDYIDGFNIEKCIDDIYSEIIKSDKLNNEGKTSRKKLIVFKLINLLSLLVPVVICIILVLIFVIKQEPFTVDIWIVIVFVASLIIHTLSYFFLRK